MSVDVYEDAILSHLSQGSSTTIEDTYPWALAKDLDHNMVVGAVKSLLPDQYIVATDIATSFYTLAAEAESILKYGSQEILVLKALIEKEKLPMPTLQAVVGKAVAKIGMANCLKNKWIKKNGPDLIPLVSLEEVEDTVKTSLIALQQGNCGVDVLDDSVSEYRYSCRLYLTATQTYNILKRRKLVTLTTRKSMSISRGPKFSPVRVKRVAALTKEMLDSGSWRELTFKPYNFSALGEKAGGGFLHPLLKVRAEFRKILMQMGFQEMPTNRWVESSFWNFDSLFQPQSHPARDAHDTFFIKHPCDAVAVPEDYYERVKNMHEDGGSGSIGYRYAFKRGEAFKNLLRTHTTAVSSQMLYKLANQEGGFQPARYFSIDRVFRNETMDATHLCEFHQVEGLVADYDLSLGDLIGTIETFFKKIGITELRFKPAFNPYTEPSMEVFGYHPDLKKWTEIGNSGMFRPEMLSPMGLPANVRVIAWGLSLERPTMIKYRIKNIRDLFGHKVELARTRAAPVCWFDSKK